MQPNNTEGDQANWSYQNEDDFSPSQQQVAPRARVDPVQWTASEFISHQKDGAWYATLGGGFFLLGAIIFFLTKDIISIVFIGIVLLLFLVIAGKKPQQRVYILDDRGIYIDDKFYSYDDFKSFALIHEGPINSVSFMPLKRLMPELSVYFAQEDEPRILDVLSANLPNFQRKEAGVDRLMKRLRF